MTYKDMSDDIYAKPLTTKSDHGTWDLHGGKKHPDQPYAVKYIREDNLFDRPNVVSVINQFKGEVAVLKEECGRAQFMEDQRTKQVEDLRGAIRDLAEALQDDYDYGHDRGRGERVLLKHKQIIKESEGWQDS